MPTPANLGPNNTLLVLTPLSGFATPFLTSYSARGVTQTLEPITGAGAGGSVMGTWLRRDVNGFLQNWSIASFQKYRSVISARDTESPCLDASWYGITIGVSCVLELSFPTGGAAARPAVAGSARTEIQGDNVTSITFYRPYLTMMLSGIQDNFSEYEGFYSWQLTLEEV